MGIYYFAVDYASKLQMWAPNGYADKKPGIYAPGHPLPCMVMMKNIQGYNFEIINDVLPTLNMNSKTSLKKYSKNICKNFLILKRNKDESL